MSDIFALVDCNNFYASCERLFLPHLEGKPVIVLSNNDGCVIARSEEAKSIGIKMGVPAFEMKELIRRNQVHVFSTNYSLYGDLSERVMNVLAGCAPHVEIYSIDEAFLDLSHIHGSHLIDFGSGIRDKVIQCTGIPVSIGIGPTKTLAKAANHLAKSRKDKKGVFSFVVTREPDRWLRGIPVSEIWGVGENYNNFFKSMGIFSALDLKNADGPRIREKIGAMGQRLVMELRGHVCYPFHENPDPKKELCTSRSFGHPLLTFDELEEATTSYASVVAMKLRKRGLLASGIIVFVMTNKYAQDPQYANYRIANLPYPSNDARTLIHYTRVALKSLFRDGYRYKKSGVIATGLVPGNARQALLWEPDGAERSGMLNEVIDKINSKNGSHAVRFAVQGSGESWKMRQNNLSARCTTRWDELLTVNLDREFS